MRPVLTAASALVLAASLAGCMSYGGGGTYSEEPLAWVRTDGQSGRANPALVDQFAADRAACGIPNGGDNFTLRGAENCMKGRGYVLVPASQAEATAARFRGTPPVAAR